MRIVVFLAFTSGGTTKGSRFAPLPFWLLVVVPTVLFHLVFLYVVQAQRDNFEDDFHHYFFPILFLLFSLHFRL